MAPACFAAVLPLSIALVVASSLTFCDALQSSSSSRLVGAGAAPPRRRTLSAVSIDARPSFRDDNDRRRLPEEASCENRPDFTLEHAGEISVNLQGSHPTEEIVVPLRRGKNCPEYSISTAVRLYAGIERMPSSATSGGATVVDAKCDYSEGEVSQLVATAMVDETNVSEENGRELVQVLVDLDKSSLFGSSLWEGTRTNGNFTLCVSATLEVMDPSSNSTRAVTYRDTVVRGYVDLDDNIFALPDALRVTPNSVSNASEVGVANYIYPNVEAYRCRLTRSQVSGSSKSNKSTKSSESSAGKSTKSAPSSGSKSNKSDKSKSSGKSTKSDKSESSAKSESKSDKSTKSDKTEKTEKTKKTDKSSKRRLLGREQLSWSDDEGHGHGHDHGLLGRRHQSSYKASMSAREHGPKNAEAHRARKLGSSNKNSKANSNNNGNNNGSDDNGYDNSDNNNDEGGNSSISYTYSAASYDGDSALVNTQNAVLELCLSPLADLVDIATFGLRVFDAATGLEQVLQRVVHSKPAQDSIVYVHPKVMVQRPVEFMTGASASSKKSNKSQKKVKTQEVCLQKIDIQTLASQRGMTLRISGYVIYEFRSEEERLKARAIGRENAPGQRNNTGLANAPGQQSRRRRNDDERGAVPAQAPSPPSRRGLFDAQLSSPEAEPDGSERAAPEASPRRALQRQSDDDDDDEEGGGDSEFNLEITVASPGYDGDLLLDDDEGAAADGLWNDVNGEEQLELARLATSYSSSAAVATATRLHLMGFVPRLLALGAAVLFASSVALV